MSPQPARGRRYQARSRHLERERRLRRLAVLAALVVVAAVVVLFSAFGGSAAPTQQTAPASASRLIPVGPPTLEAIAKLGALHLQLPVSQARVTAIGFQGGTEGSLALDPIGTQANQGLLRRLARKLVGDSSTGPRWYQLPGGGLGPGTSALDVGAPSGTDVFSPVDGSVVAVEPLVLDGARLGSTIEIQPTGSASLVVDVSHVRVDPALFVGSPVTAGGTRLGSIVDFSHAERQALSQYTNDAGNHVVIEVHPSASLAVG
ncbi:MAG TPA: hypothetical protein VLV46_12050 [Gaiellaceae bacterium]|nr:hypothetical protein [Gaiellaceae bacterium]